MDVIELTKALVRIPSVTGHEGPVGQFVATELERSGWRVTTQDIPSVGDGGPRCNVLACCDDAKPRVVLTTHLDTVPPVLDVWEDDEHLYGRGTCDAKGIFAAQWVAAERLRAEGHGGVALLGVVGEETDSVGAKRVGEILPAADWIIDGEPTGLILASGAKGVLSIEIEVQGVAAHSAYPERGRSAIHVLLAGLQRLLAAELPSEERFGPTTVNVGRIGGGVAPNVLAPSATAEVMIRLGTSGDAVAEAVQTHLGPDIYTRVVTRAEPQVIHVPDGYDGAVVRFGSDVPHLSAIGTPLLVGPGSIHHAHTKDERVGKQALRDAVELYVRLGRVLLDGDSTG